MKIGLRLYGLKSMQQKSNSYFSTSFVVFFNISLTCCALSSSCFLVSFSLEATFSLLALNASQPLSQSNVASPFRTMWQGKSFHKKRTETGFVHFFSPEIQGLFKDFPRPYFNNLRTSQNMCRAKTFTAHLWLNVMHARETRRTRDEKKKNNYNNNN